MTTEIILVRHGQTAWNVEGRYQGQSDPPLNELGREQAHEVARALSDVEADAIYSSDLRRASQTAQVIAETLNLPFHTDTRLREIQQGRWEGMLYADIERDFAEELASFRESPLDRCPPEGETLGALAGRFFAALDEIATAHSQGRVIVVTHKLPMAIIRCQLEMKPPPAVWTALPENTGILKIDWPLPAPGEDWR